MRNVSPALALVLVGAACVLDPADREYFTALRGDEAGLSREQILVHLDRAIELAPNRVHYWETRAIYRIDARQFEGAEADLERGIELADRAYLRFLRGLVRCQRGEFTSAVPEFDIAIAAQPINTQFYRGRALARAALGRYDEALADAERLIELSPQRAESYYARGMALAGLQRHEEALADFDQALDRRPELVYPLFARADSHERLEHHDLAAADRTLAERRSERKRNCALCLDPFRY